MTFQTYAEECAARAKALREEAEKHEKRERETEDSAEVLDRRIFAARARTQAAYWARRAERTEVES